MFIYSTATRASRRALVGISTTECTPTDLTAHGRRKKIGRGRKNSRTGPQVRPTLPLSGSRSYGNAAGQCRLKHVTAHSKCGGWAQIQGQIRIVSIFSFYLRDEGPRKCGPAQLNHTRSVTSLVWQEESFSVRINTALSRTFLARHGWHMSESPLQFGRIAS